MREPIHTESAPKAIGPYSQAISCDGWLYCSGQIPLDPISGEIIGNDVSAQTHQVMKNLGAVLEAGGSGFSKVVKTTIYLKSMDDFAAVNEVYGSYLSDPYPARVTIQAARLPKDVFVEVDAIARA